MSNTTITIRTDDDIAEKIGHLAESMDRSRNWVIEDALRQYIENQAWQIQGIHDAIESLDRGEGIAHKKVMAGIEKKIAKKTKRSR